MNEVWRENYEDLTEKQSLVCIMSSDDRHTGKGKVHPRKDHEGPEGEYSHSSTLSLTSALDEGGWSTPRPGRFTPKKDPVPIV